MNQVHTLSQKLVECFSKHENVRRTRNSIVISVAFYFIIKKLHMGFFGPLSKLPGPFITRFIEIPRIVLETPRGTTFQKIHYFHDRYGEIVRLAPNSLSISNKSMIKDVLAVEDLQKGLVYHAMQHNGEATLLTATDKKWHKNRRRVISPAFSIKYLNSLEPFMVNCVKTFIHQIDTEIELTKDNDGYGDIDIWNLLQRLALDVIGETSFGKSFNMIENNNHVVPGAISQTLRITFIRAVMPLLSKVLLINTKNSRTIVEKFLRDIINERLTNKLTERDDILQFLINKHKATDINDRLNLTSIIEETSLILMAGSETTSSSLGFLFYELLRNPIKLAKLYEEIDAIQADEEGFFRHEQLKSLPYLNAVINETLRLNPVTVVGLSRITTEPTILGDLVLPENIKVNANMFHLQRNEKHWPKPLEFIPERWTEETELNDLEAYLPFSLGSRNCVGKNFAFQEMRLTVVAVLKNFDIKLIESEMEQAKIRRQFVTQRIAKNSFRIKMKRRS